MAFFNTRDAGPIVLGNSTGGDDGSLNGNIRRLSGRCRWRTPGPLGADAGKGGKYLLLTPGYAGSVPDGYTVLRPATYGSYALIYARI